MTILLQKPCIAKVSTMGEGGQKLEHVVYGYVQEKVGKEIHYRARMKKSQALNLRRGEDVINHREGPHQTSIFCRKAHM